jgi:hypothetical protein
MFYALLGYLHAAVMRRVQPVQALAAGESGQGTVEYVGLVGGSALSGPGGE